VLCFWNSKLPNPHPVLPLLVNCDRIKGWWKVYVTKKIDK